MVREFCLGGGADPGLHRARELLGACWILPDAHRLLPGPSPPGQNPAAEHFALQTPQAGCRAGGELAAGVPWSPPLRPALAAWSRRWPPSGGVALRIADRRGDHHWPSLQQLAARGDEQPLAERLQSGRLGSGRWQEGPGPGPGCSAPCSGSAGCSRRSRAGSEQRKKRQRSLGNGSPCWRICWDSGGRSPRSGGGAVRYPATAAGELHWGYLWLDLAPWPATANRVPR